MQRLCAAYVEASLTLLLLISQLLSRILHRPPPLLNDFQAVLKAHHTGKDQCRVFTQAQARRRLGGPRQGLGREPQ